MSGEALVVDTSRSPNARVRSVPLDSVRWTEGYWTERWRQNGEVTLPVLWELLADPDAGHVLENFRIAAGLAEGKHEGTNWQDEWLYKWIEAAACIYRLTGEAWIAEKMDEAIDLIGRAQEPDGYVSTQITVPGKPRFRDLREHEAYNMGHLMTAAAVHRRMTGSDGLFRIAIRAADFLSDTLGVSVSCSFAHNPSAIMGLVELYRETGDRKYLACAQRIVDDRGKDPQPGGMYNHVAGFAGTDQIQDRVPLREEAEVVGHNVFFTYLFTGATDVYLETGDETLLESLRRLWHDLRAHKMCINGGVSPMGHGLSPRGDSLVEAVGAAYFLPAASSYNETCGQIGNWMWNFRMLLAEGDGCYADVMELEAYNGIFSGIGLDGQSWWYRNPLRRYDKDYQPKGLSDLTERGQPGRRRICCPSNLVRTLAKLQSTCYGVSDDGVWIHHFGGSTFFGSLPSGEAFALEQTSDYPWEGAITVTIQEAPEGPITVRLRIPGWVEDASLSVNGEAADSDVTGGYAELERVWRAGDRIDLDLAMPVRLMAAHPKVEQLRNQVAVMRGPVLYCLESPDLPEDVDLNDVYLPSDASLQPEAAEDLPFGIRTLVGEGLHRPEDDWGDTLYRTLEPRDLSPIPMRMIPYFAWANRGQSQMSVWLPVVWRDT